MSGWIKTHRALQNHYLWQDKPFARGQAWIDILLLASHKENKFMLGNELFKLERGTFITSEIKLMERWGWSKSKVRSFLAMLEKDSMLVKKTDQKKTTLKVLNYDVWQDCETTKEPQKNHKKTTKEPQKDTIKNVKNDKNVKEVYKSIIDYLNQKTGKQYKDSSAKTKSLIDARLSEGFTEEDFMIVIDIKSREWDNNEMSKFLRPETLFSNKFEGYLNQKPKKIVKAEAVRPIIIDIDRE